MKNLINSLITLFIVITWIMGVVYAFDIDGGHGIVSIVTGPFYAWYLVVKHAMIHFGILDIPCIK